MNKKLIIFLMILIVINIFIITRIIIKKQIIIEDNTGIKVKDNLQLNVYEEYYVKDLVVGNIINNDLIDTSELGSKSIEVIYKNKEDEKRKAIVEYEVVDKVKPLILGSSTYKVVLGNDLDLRYMYLSVDNYDKNPLREVIGEYDYNKLGKYKLKFRVTDSSNNVNEKDLIIDVVSKIEKKSSNYSTILYSDIYKKYKTNNTKIGLDISRWQEDVDFNQLKESNVEFVFLRIGFQKGFKNELGMDSYFLDNIKKANEVGIPVGLYFYSYATTKAEAIEQADWIIDKIKDYRVELPIAFDWEAFNLFSKQNMSIYDLNNVAKTFIKRIEEKGYKGINYSSKFYLENIWSDEYPTWLAHYTDKTTYKGKYYMWQMTDRGRVSGIKGNVDVNIMYE